MAYAATLQWVYDAVNGNAANGGAFDPTAGVPGTNYAWGAGQHVYGWAAAGGDCTNDLASTQASGWLELTSVARPFVAADVGNTINIQSGTNFTPGRYVILSVAAGVATLHAACGATGNASAGAGRLGGALDVPTSALLNLAVAGNTVWLSANGLATGTTFDCSAAAITCTVNGTAAAPILFRGFSVTPDDDPDGAKRPTISMGANTITFANYWKRRSIVFTGAVSTLVQDGSFNGSYLCKGYNTRTSAGTAFGGGASSFYITCEGQARLGAAFSLAASGAVIGCYAHDSLYGVYINSATPGAILDTLIESCAYGWYANSAVQGENVVGNTIRNCGTGLYATTASHNHFLRNLITGNLVGANWTTTTPHNDFDHNCWFNNGTDVALNGGVASITKGPHDINLDPSYATPMIQGTDGSTNGSPGTTFTSASSKLSSLTTGDCLVVKAGSGATVGVYAIAAVAPGGDATKLTLATSPGNSLSAVTFGVIAGSVGANNHRPTNPALLGKGAPALFPGCGTPTSVAPGAAQWQKRLKKGIGIFT